MPDPQNCPRLIVSWPDTSSSETRDGAQLRYRGDPSDATPWRYSHPNGVVVSTLLGGLNIDLISAGPAFHGDDILLHRQSAERDSTLYGIGWGRQQALAILFPATRRQVSKLEVSDAL